MKDTESIIQLFFMFIIMIIAITKIDTKILLSVAIAGILIFIYVKQLDTDNSNFINKMTTYLNYFNSYAGYKHLYKNANLLIFLYELHHEHSNNRQLNKDITNKIIQFIIEISKNHLDIADTLRKDILNILHSYIYVNIDLEKLTTLNKRLEYLLLDHMNASNTSNINASNINASNINASNIDINNHEFYL